MKNLSVSFQNREIDNPLIRGLRARNIGEQRREWQRDFWRDNCLLLGSTEMRGDLTLISSLSFFGSRSRNFPMYEGMEKMASYFPTIVSAERYTPFHLDELKTWLRAEIQWTMDLELISAIFWTYDNRVRFESTNCIASENWLDDSKRRIPFIAPRPENNSMTLDGIVWPLIGTDSERESLLKDFSVGDFILTVTSELWSRTSTAMRQELVNSIAQTGFQTPAIIIADDGMGFDINQMKDWLLQKTANEPGLAFVKMVKDVNFLTIHAEFCSFIRPEEKPKSFLHQVSNVPKMLTRKDSLTIS